MSYKILDGKYSSSILKNKICQCIQAIGEGERKPCLAVVSVGNNLASQSYIRGKKRDCEECGIEFREYNFDESCSNYELVSNIYNIDCDNNVDGIIVQLPLPSHLNASIVINNSISLEKDVDGFLSVNMGKLMEEGIAPFVPCTPSGIIKLLQDYSIPIAGKHCVVIGRSNIVGKPIAQMLLKQNATVTMCHSKTQNLEHYTRHADIIVCAVGKPKFLTKDMVKKGVVVIDVGINRDENGKLCGDVDFENVAPKCSYITPVPGGVGLMTRAMLMQNVLKAWANRNGLII